jgi:hypothetical protein
MDGTFVVSLDKYWMYVALPLFIYVMGFGIFVLFRIGGSQTAESPTVLSTIASLKDRPLFFRERQIRARKLPSPIGASAGSAASGASGAAALAAAAVAKAAVNAVNAANS